MSGFSLHSHIAKLCFEWAGTNHSSPFQLKGEWQNYSDFIWSYFDVTKILCLRHYLSRLSFSSLLILETTRKKSRKVIKSLVSEICSHIFPVEGTFLCLFTQRRIWLVKNWTLSNNSRLTSPAIITNHLLENEAWHYHLMPPWAKLSLPSASQSSVHTTCTSLPPTFMGIQSRSEHENTGIKYSLLRK